MASCGSKILSYQISNSTDKELLFSNSLAESQSSRSWVQRGSPLGHLRSGVDGDVSIMRLLQTPAAQGEVDSTPTGCTETELQRGGKRACAVVIGGGVIVPREN